MDDFGRSRVGCRERLISVTRRQRPIFEVHSRVWPRFINFLLKSASSAFPQDFGTDLELSTT
jgi:hypothetical protein